ncbi:helix-turn-helix domain-containing protein [Amycolatopsis sp. lyj-90]|uniref:helix-turn-helix domain-containing protein n=1 Tax=Amycolatopsis sp. lyj-90 TaxID=2789285 RepID=UPI003978581E
MNLLPEPFGVRLRTLRTAQGWSLTELARRLYYSKGHVSRIETGAQSPSMEFVRRCDAELDAKGALITMMTPEASSGTEIVRHDREDEEVWLMMMTPGGGSSFTPLGRREVLVGGAVILAGLGLPSVARPVAANVDEQLQHHRRLHDAARDLGQIAAPTTVLPMLIGQAQALRSLAKSAHGSTAKDVALLTARTAEFAGWMAQEAGDEAAAAWWTDKAVDVATAVGDTQTAGYAMVRRALVTLYQGEGQATVELARRAQVHRALSPRVLALAAQREAQGHALVGDYDACMRALDSATKQFAVARSSGQDGPTIGTSHISDPVAVVTGWCLYDLGRPAEAAQVLDRAIRDIPADAIRARTRFGVRLALAHAASGELDRSCELARELLGNTAMVGSATIRSDVQRLAVTLRRWNSHSSVRAIEPSLTAALYSA